MSPQDPNRPDEATEAPKDPADGTSDQPNTETTPAADQAPEASSAASDESAAEAPAAEEAAAASPEDAGAGEAASDGEASAPAEAPAQEAADEAADGAAEGAAEEAAASSDEGSEDTSGDEAEEEAEEEEEEVDERPLAERAQELLQRAQELVEQPAKQVHDAWPKLGRRFRKLGDGIDEAVTSAWKELSGRLDSLRSQHQAQRRNDNLARLSGLANQLEKMQEVEDTQEINLRKAERCLREAQLAFKGPGPLPESADWDALKKRFETSIEALTPRVKQLAQEEEWKRWANVPLQEELCAKMEALKESNDMPYVARQVRELSNEWRTVASAPKERAEELWQRFRGAREGVRERLNDYFDKQKVVRKENLKKKEALCEQAESLKDSEDWRNTAEAFKGLQAQWKKIGPVPRKQSETIWQRFRGACDHFFDRRKSHFDDLQGERDSNLKLKEGLIQRAEAIKDSTDWNRGTERLKALQQEWKAVGPVPRKFSESLWQRFRSACDHFFDRRSRRHELHLDGNVEQKEKALEELLALLPPKPKKKQAAEEPKAEAAEAAPTEEAAAEAAPTEEAAAEAAPAEAAATEEAAAEAAPTEEAADAAPEEAAAEAAPAEEAAAEDAPAEEAAPAEAAPTEEAAAEEAAPAEEATEAEPEPPAVPENLSEQVNQLLESYRKAGEVPKSREGALQKSYLKVANQLIAAYGDHLGGTDLDPEILNKKREQLAQRIEKAVKQVEAARVEEEESKPSLQDLASQLQAALAANTIRKGAPPADDPWHSRSDRVQGAQRAWENLPGTAPEELTQRFDAAVKGFEALEPDS